MATLKYRRVEHRAAFGGNIDRFTPWMGGDDSSMQYHFLQAAASTNSKRTEKISSPLPNSQSSPSKNTPKNGSQPLSTYVTALRSEMIDDGYQGSNQKVPVVNLNQRKQIDSSRSFREQVKESSRVPGITPFQEKNPISLNPTTCKLLSSSITTPQRRMPKSPYKILQTAKLNPRNGIQDDFYLNLLGMLAYYPVKISLRIWQGSETNFRLDWSNFNIVSVGLGSAVCLWNCNTNTSSILHDFGYSLSDMVTCVKWMPRGDYLVVGTRRGRVDIWDVCAKKCVLSYFDHSSRGSVVATGSRDHKIRIRDIRKKSTEPKYASHNQEVCGLEWSPDDRYLASGGNDNKLLVWDVAQQSKPYATYLGHQAAVKALCWSPHKRGLLASGGGTADRCIRFWSLADNECLKVVDTSSQVSNLVWSKNVDELVSTHGYSQNQVVVWSFPSMTSLATLMGHRSRVLYLAASPDGESIVSGAGDETLRFWNVFPPNATKSRRIVSSQHSLIR